MRFIAVALVVWGSAASASESTLYLDQIFADYRRDPFVHLETLSPEAIYRRTQIVLDHFRVPAEPSYQSELDSFAATTTLAQMPAVQKALDPSNQFARFFDRAGENFTSFRDRDAKKVEEYRASLATSAPEGSPKKRGLAGMRIALDPGHMGGDTWDTRTGKFVKDSNGNKLSEGLLNLQTALLMETRLRALGAEVMITHRHVGPVSKMRYEDLSIQEFGRKELRGKTLGAWFQDLLAANSEASLGQAFENSTQVKKAFSEIMRSDYYAMREDLNARAEAIAAFAPDMTIFIHFDADIATPNPRARNITRAYVPGAFEATEFATSENRARFLSHLVQGQQWRESVLLSEKIIGRINKDLAVPIPATDMPGTQPVGKGVFARNLGLTRVVNHSVISYLEALRYGNSEEFYRLLKKDGGTLTIDGRAYSYSKRLAQLADSIVNGIVEYTTANHTHN